MVWWPGASVREFGTSWRTSHMTQQVIGHLLCSWGHKLRLGLFWYFPVSSQLSALCTVDATLSWVFIHVSDLLYTVCTSSGLPNFYYYFYVYPFYIYVLRSLWGGPHFTAGCVLYINVYVTNKNLQSESYLFK